MRTATLTFANKRCNAPLVTSGSNQYCPSFYTTREPGRSYTNVFTTFVPAAPFLRVSHGREFDRRVAGVMKLVEHIGYVGHDAGAVA